MPPIPYYSSGLVPGVHACLNNYVMPAMAGIL